MAHCNIAVINIGIHVVYLIFITIEMNTKLEIKNVNFDIQTKLKISDTINELYLYSNNL
jgi:hypothetical protein